MILYSEALDIVLNAASPKETCQSPFAECQGRVLAEDIRSDIDMPPFNKSAVDGFACRTAVGTGHAPSTQHAPSFQITETIPAGTVPKHKIGPGECARIMTGAMVPEDADMVVMVEYTQETDDGRVMFNTEESAPNICYQGEDIRKGDLVLSAGTLIGPPEIAIMASVGATSPNVWAQPRVAMIATGDELVVPEQNPGPGMIRNSNSAQLIAQAKRIGIQTLDLGIAQDTEEDLYKIIQEGLDQADVLLLTGGVSMGDFDYVPAVMEQAGVEILFKSIAIQPGRPTVFGRKGDQFVFGLPGNPVSSFVLFELLVKPFLYQLMGHEYQAPMTYLPMGESYSRKKSARKSILPVSIREGHVYPVNYHGSAHIHSYIHANGMVAIEIGNTQLKKGELVDVRLL